MVNLRLNSAYILQKILEDKVFFGDLKKQIPEKDLPFVNMLILTALRRWCCIEDVLNSFLQHKIPNKHRLAKYLLGLAIVELLYMDTAPYAVINETVNGIKKSCDRFMGGMANAILRKVIEQKIALQDKINNLSPIPETFLPVLDGYSADEIQQIKNSVQFVAPLDITVKKDPIEWQKKFSAQLMPNGSLRLFNAPRIHELPEYSLGLWWVQDVAASLPVLIMGDIADLDIIDLCAAPGGKTAQLAAQNAKVTALDISDVRLNTLKQNMARLGFSNIKTICDDAIHFMENSEEQFDIVLLDAPCSATGTFRRHPEVLYIKDINDVREQAKLQKQMLNLCKKILKVGGFLVYSVCSISKIEGEQQIAEFLKDNPNYKLTAIKEKDISLFGKWKENILLPNGTIRTLPFYSDTKNSMDSFFICKMQRII